MINDGKFEEIICEDGMELRIDIGKGKKDNSKKINKSHDRTFKLGEVMANGVKYFGREKMINRHKTCMCICPKCGELWRVLMSSVISGDSKSCCGRGSKKAQK